MQQFLITLKNEKIFLYNRISWFIIIINVILLSYLAIFASEKDIRNGSLASLTVLFLVFALYLYFRKTKYRFGPSAFFYILMLGWIENEYYWLGAVVLLFYILHGVATGITVLTISNKGILYPSVFKKNTGWQNLSNLILKDGLLTIDFKNNKISQQLVDENKTSVDEKEFNEFCKEQLNLLRHGQFERFDPDRPI